MKVNYVNMKTNLRRFAALLLCLSALLSVLVFSGCNKENGNENSGKNDGASDEFALTDAQKANILAISEAFAELGKSYNTNEPLTVAEMESFVYYLYNGELKADESGYGEVSGEDAVARIKMYFGIASVLHTRKNSADQEFYYSNGVYYVKEKASVVEKASIISAKKGDDGNSSVSVEASCTDGSRIVLDFSFKIEGDSTLVLSCTRYDER